MKQPAYINQQTHSVAPLVAMVHSLGTTNININTAIMKLNMFTCSGTCLQKTIPSQEIFHKMQSVTVNMIKYTTFMLYNANLKHEFNELETLFIYM